MSPAQPITRSPGCGSLSFTGGGGVLTFILPHFAALGYSGGASVVLGCFPFFVFSDCSGASSPLLHSIVFRWYLDAYFQQHNSFVFETVEFASRVHATFKTGTPFWMV